MSEPCAPRRGPDETGRAGPYRAGAVVGPGAGGPGGRFSEFSGISGFSGFSGLSGFFGFSGRGAAPVCEHVGS